ncbi:MAG: hypothetical protein PVG78_06645 [Desulfobacterales bacterium]
MKISELLAAVDEGWVRKPKWFRVRFQTRVDGRWVTDTVPGEGQTPFDSDVVSWRSAWKLCQAAESGAGDFVNITVVDDRGEPFRYYATGRCEVFNPRPEVAGSPPIGAQPPAAAEEDEVLPDEQPGSGGEDTGAQAGSDATDK